MYSRHWFADWLVIIFNMLSLYLLTNKYIISSYINTFLLHFRIWNIIFFDNDEQRGRKNWWQKDFWRQPYSVLYQLFWNVMELLMKQLFWNKNAYWHAQLIPVFLDKKWVKMPYASLSRAKYLKLFVIFQYVIIMSTWTSSSYLCLDNSGSHIF